MMPAVTETPGRPHGGSDGINVALYQAGKEVGIHLRRTCVNELRAAKSYAFGVAESPEWDFHPIVSAAITSIFLIVKINQNGLTPLSQRWSMNGRSAV
jgi:hypothetical protein